MSSQICRIVNNFWTRLFFGALFVGATLIAVLWHFGIFLLLFLLFIIASAYEFNKLLNKKGIVWVNVASTGLMFLILGLAFFDVFDIVWISVLIIPLIIVLYTDIKNNSKPNNSLSLIYTLLYPGLGFVFMLLLLFTPIKDYNYSTQFLLALLIIVWVNDTFAYLTGRLLGKTPVFPGISPKKTVEGSIGGIVFALIAGYVLSRFWELWNIWQWLGFAFFGVIGAIAGDFFESFLKRKKGVKDSGMFLPGHGGALDRFDSLLFAAPVVWIYILILFLI
ncbi:MAG: phosphatidate cytidylyltransferase [Bacteroidales bacterium]|nr:phosphatidate cytidylyltransferase [Bacteroidales bacterium]